VNREGGEGGEGFNSTGSRVEAGISDQGLGNDPLRPPPSYSVTKLLI